MRTNIYVIAADPKYLTSYSPSYGIPTYFWIARKEAFAAGTPPVLLFEDYHKLGAVTISSEPHLTLNKHCDHNSMLFKLVRRTVLRLKNELLQIWEGSDINHFHFQEKFLAVEDMTREQRIKLRHLNARLIEVEKQLRSKFSWAKAKYPGHCTGSKIHYILAEDDQEFSDHDDNILVSRHDPTISDADDGYNYNDYGADPIRTENGEIEYHCSLYRDLYSYSGLEWEDLLRIGKIWVQFKVNFDIDFDIYDNGEKL